MLNYLYKRKIRRRSISIYCSAEESERAWEKESDEEYDKHDKEVREEFVDDAWERAEQIAEG